MQNELLEVTLVDVFIPRPRPFPQSQLTRAQRWVFALETEVSAKFASPEDTILSRLEWHRRAARCLKGSGVTFSAF